MTWRRVQLKQVASVSVSNVDKRSLEHERPVMLCNYVDVYKNKLIDASLDFMRATASPAQIRAFGLRAGDTVITKDSETAEDIAVPAYVGETVEDLVCGYHLAVVRPGPEVDPKYLFWCLWSQPLREQAAVAATGVTRFGLRQESMRNALVDLPGLDEQRRIADFLDLETDRIDRLLSLRRRQLAAVESRFDRILWDEFGRLENQKPLKAVAWYREGPGIMSAEFRNSGTPVLRLGCLKNDTITLEGCNFVDPDEARRRWSHLAVRPGELLISGSAGTRFPVAIPEDVAGSIPYTGLIRIAPRDERVLLTDYLRFFLGSPRFSTQVDQMKNGIGLQHWGPSHLSQVCLTVPSLVRQQAVVESLGGVMTSLQQMRRRTHEQARLYQERRQAVVTAAVTGQQDVATAEGIV